ncbi:MAG: hypothetical protein K8S87_04515, partial [Planctomycetes bacterium]|nr:hypothetical protein [Planctomycetota bacterium]
GIQQKLEYNNVSVWIPVFSGMTTLQNLLVSVLKACPTAFDVKVYLSLSGIINHKNHSMERKDCFSYRLFLSSQRQRA